MKKDILNFCYRFLIKTKLVALISKLLSQRISYTSERSLKKEFGGSYNVITTVAKSSFLGGKTIGSVCSQSGYWEELSYDYCVLRSLWVHPILQRRGIGHKLVNLCIGNAKTAGFKYLMLTCFVDNLVAKSLYEKMGFNNLNEPISLGDKAHFELFEKERLYAEEINDRESVCYWIKL